MEVFSKSVFEITLRYLVPTSKNVSINLIYAVSFPPSKFQPKFKLSPPKSTSRTFRPLLPPMNNMSTAIISSILTLPPNQAP